MEAAIVGPEVTAPPAAAPARRPRSVPEELWASVPEADRDRVSARGASLLRRGFPPAEALSVALDELGIETAPVAAPARPAQAARIGRGLRPAGARAASTEQAPPAQRSVPANEATAPVGDTVAATQANAPASPRPAAEAAAVPARPVGLRSMSRRLGARPAPAQPPASALAHAIQEAIGDAGRPSPEALEIERDLLALVVSDPAGAAMDPRYLRPLGRRMTTRLADAVAQLVEDEAYRTIDSIRALRAAGDPDAANWLDPDDSTTWETGKPGWR